MLIATLIVATPTIARAQDPCPPEALDCEVDSLPPSIIITPAGMEIHSAAPITFTVRWCDQLGLYNYYDERQLTWRGVNVRSSFSSIQWPDQNIPVNCNQKEAERGTLTPAPGPNNLFAQTTDNSGNIGQTFLSFNYDVVDVVAQRGIARRGAGAASKTRLWVKNVGSESYSFIMRSSCASGATCTSVSPASATIAAHDSVAVDVSYTTGGTVATENLVGVIAKYSGDTTVADSAKARIEIIPASYAVEVTPRWKSVPAITNTTTTVNFVVRNAGNAGTSYTLTATCAAGATSCSAPGSTSSVLAGDSAIVGVSFNPGTATAGTVSLRAVAGTARDSATYTIRAQAGNKPHVTIDSLGTGTVVERSECVIGGAGLDAAYECGDLRLAHALPSIRTLNKERTPVLLYNSAHAEAAPVVGAYVSIPTGGSIPTTVIAKLRSGGLTYDSAQWSGSEWAAGQTRRIALRAKNISAGQSKLAAITVVVTFDYSGTQQTDSASGSVVIVDRKKSSFGPGWWLAGLEKVIPLGGVPSDSLLLWIGGDGSARRYVKRAGVLVWDAERLDQRDTLTKNGSGEYLRYLPHGVKIKFDASGRHIATINRLSDSTLFRYSGTTSQLDSIVVPTASSTVKYAFQYLDTLIQTITIPGVTGSRSVVFSRDAAKRISGIRDLDSSTVGFEFATSSSPRITARINRNATRTVFTYDTVAKLASAKVEMQEGSGRDIVTSYRVAESRGAAGGGSPASIADDRVYTLIDGPRTDVGDTTQIWLNRFGAPRLVRDPIGKRTTVLRENATYPTLVTRVRTPRGYTTAATYDSLGYLATSVDSGTYVVSGSVYSYATTRYEWDSKWNMVSKVVMPDGRDSTRIAYDATNGNRLSQRNTAGDSVTFRYASHGRVVAISRPRNAPGTGMVKDSLGYDTSLGNISDAWTPLLTRTSRLTDAFGRDTLMTGQIDATHRDTTRLSYDWASRVVSSNSSAPKLSYSYMINGTPVTDTTGAAVGWTKNMYDVEGNLLQVKRGSIPNINALDTVRTSKYYDRANRLTGEINAAVIGFAYDVAGNVVQASHGGLQADMTYDVLGRVTRRVAQSVVYSNTAGDFRTLQDNRFAQPRFPDYYWFSPVGVPEETRFIVPPDTAVFAYDSLGNMLEARNGDAWVFRAYRANGAVASDTLLIRTVATLDSGGSFRQHVYPLSYTYDIMGRRTQGSGVGPTVTSQYDSLGRLKSVQSSSSGHTFRFVYTRNGELDSLVYPNQVFQSNVYDDDGRLTLRKEWRTTTTFHADTMTYDARGKLLTSRGVGVEAGNAYDGFGALARSTRRSTPNGWDTSDESFWVDALGYQRSRSAGPLRSDTIVYRYTASNAQHAATNFPNGTGTSEGSLTADTTYYDDAGGRNIYLSETATTSNYQFESSAYFYDGNGRLRIADVRRCSNTGGYTCVAGLASNPLPSGAFEEYRYDALGRRVWVRARKDGRCSASQDDCTSTLTRTVWDGDQIVAEYRTLGGNSVQATDLETDGGSLTKTGTITYVHGPGIDQPLEVSRNSSVVVPYYNWRGLADQGSYGTCHDFEHTGGGPFYCGSVEWPAARLEIYSNLKAGKARTVSTYWGSLLQESQDASGLLYRRNRYYDGTSGKFTQEDPIGIAGGLNVYGYANGDPVSYSDPFGLCTPKWLCNLLDNSNAGYHSVLRELGIEQGSPITGEGRAFALGRFGALLTFAMPTARTFPSGATKASAIEGGAAELSPSVQKSIQSIERNVAEHLDKLEKYKANPDAFDNLGKLKNASQEIREKIINGRIKHLEDEIQMYRNEIQVLRNPNMT